MHGTGRNKEQSMAQAAVIKRRRTRYGAVCCKKKWRERSSRPRKRDGRKTIMTISIQSKATKNILPGIIGLYLS